MKTDCNVSIVVLTRNQIEYTRRCFEALVEHTRSFEVIVVDNGSQDGTVEFLGELASRDRRFKPLLNPQNVGFAAGCNQGVAAARFEVVCLLNNDTEPLPGWLEALRLSLTREVGAVGAKLLLNDGCSIQHCGISFEHRTSPRPHFWPSHPLLGFPEEVREASVRRELLAVTGACLLTTKAAWSRVGGLEPAYAVANFEDVDYCLKLRAAGLAVVYEPKSRLVHHWGTTVDSMTGEPDSPANHFEQNLRLFNARWYEPLKATIASRRVC